MKSNFPDNFVPKKGLRYFIALVAGTAGMTGLPAITSAQDCLIVPNLYLIQWFTFD